MGLSPWWNDPSGWGPASPLVPLPLLDGAAIVEQPTLLQNLTGRYVTRAQRFIGESARSGQPWVLFMSWNHVHNPQFCSAAWCGTAPNVTGKGAAIPSGHGGTGSAVQELDWAVGELMATLKTTPCCDENTLVFFTRSPYPREHAQLPSLSLISD